MEIDGINSLGTDELKEKLLSCCGSQVWADRLQGLRPFTDENDLIEKSNAIWYRLDEEDWLAAFSKHPRIGDIDSLRKKYGVSENWSKQEQSAVEHTSEKVLYGLKEQNDLYYEKNGFIFIVFATGKSAAEMLNILQTRLQNTREQEVEIAGREQNKITRLRLGKLLYSA